MQVIVFIPRPWFPCYSDSLGNFGPGKEFKKVEFPIEGGGRNLKVLELWVQREEKRKAAEGK